ncbi:MAG: pentalenic acid synthase, partial [Kribbellaceae bacterium]|nr:pentalenic acid synthase [Kribbellaceae bacterium]
MPDFPMPRGTCPFDQHPGYAEAAAQGPLTKVSMAHGQIVWFVTGYAETRALFADSRLSVDRTNPGYPGSAAATPEQLANMAETQSFNQLDDPEHAAYRRLAIPSLTVRRVKELRPALQAAVDTIVDDLLTTGPVADLVPGLAVPLPSIMLALLYGIPDEDRPYFEQRVRQAATDPRFGGRALSELSSYLERLLESKDGDGADLLNGLMSGRRADLVTQRRVLNLAMQTLVAGN